MTAEEDEAFAERSTLSDQIRWATTGYAVNGFDLNTTVPGPYMPADRAHTRGKRGDVGFEGKVELLFEELETLLLSKHADYGPANVGGSPGGPLNGLRVRLWDKLARINHLVDTDRDPKHEALADSFADLANYSIIALLVLRGDWPQS